MDDVMPGMSDDGVVSETVPAPPMAMAIGAFASLLQLDGRMGVKDLEAERRRRQSPWNSLSGSWAIGGNSRRELKLADGTSALCTSYRDGSYDIQVGAEREDEKENPPVTFHINGTMSSNQMEVVVNHSHRIFLTTAMQEKDGMFQVCMWPKSPELLNTGSYFWEVSVENPLLPSSMLHSSTASSGQGIVKAPMPGKISRINFGVGDTVEEGEVLLLMEAMKMEHTVLSPISGVVQSVSYQVNDVVADGAVLAMVESVDEVEPEAI